MQFTHLKFTIQGFFSIFTHIIILEHFHHPQKEAPDLGINPQLFPNFPNSRQPLIYSLDLPILDISC